VYFNAYTAHLCRRVDDISLLGGGSYRAIAAAQPLTSLPPPLLLLWLRRVQRDKLPEAALPRSTHPLDARPATSAKPRSSSGQQVSSTARSAQ